MSMMQNWLRMVVITRSPTSPDASCRCHTLLLWLSSRTGHPPTRGTHARETPRTVPPGRRATQSTTLFATSWQLLNLAHEREPLVVVHPQSPLSTGERENQRPPLARG